MRADRDEKRRGVSWWWVIPALVLAGFLMVKAPMLLAKILSGATMGAAKMAAESYKLGNVITNQTGETSGLFATAKAETPKTSSHPRAFTLHAPALRQDPKPKTNEVYLTGISTLGGRVVVYLSNGEFYTSDDRELQFVSKRIAIINGNRFAFAPPVSSNQPNPPQRSQPAFGF
ncbi:MAG: hypothetical protein HY735_01575 [Verrucomicrobia bacterium]|nr:hypothetical protein [Verrucomicrobiota bacterium]